MATYLNAPREVEMLVDELIGEYYPDLLQCEATVGVLMARPPVNKYGIAKGPAVTAYGLAALGKLHINSLADRVEGKPDATITLDMPHWEELSSNALDGPARKRALVDRFLYALDVKRHKKTGRMLSDDHGRPLLKARKPSWALVGFRAMADRHKEHSIEVIQARQLRETYGQLLFDFADDQAELPGVEARPSKAARKARGPAKVAAARR